MRFALCIFVAATMLGAVAQEPEAPKPEPEVTADKLSDEAALLATLQGDAGFVEKQFALRALKKVGTAQSVPVIAGLLNDPTLSHIARYALESMEAPEAGQALRDAVAKTSGGQQVGVIISLGARGDAEAVSAIHGAVMEDQRPELIRAAAGALGRIATPEAIQLLQEGAGMVSPELRPYLAEGLLAAGDILREKGSAGEAANIYKGLMNESWPEYVRLGAFRGLTLVQPAEAPDMLMTALGGDDEVMRGFAAQLVTEIEGDFSPEEYLEAVHMLGPAGQAALLRGLAGRRDPAARLAAVEAMKSGEAPVRLAAIQAMAALGTPEDVAPLAVFLLDQEEALAAAARLSLKNLPGKEVDLAIATQLEGAPAEEQALLLQLLSDRMSPETLRVATARLSSDAEAVKIAALDALAQQGTAVEAPAVVAALKEADSTGVRQAAARALGSIAAHHGKEALPAMLTGMEGAEPEAKLAIVRTLDRVGSTEALNATLGLLKDADQRISSEAARVLSNWPSQEAAPHLLTLAQGESSALKDAGLRGYVRLARDEQDLGKRVEMLNSAMAQAGTPQEKFIVLAAWGTVPTPQALDTLQPHLDDSAVQNEAATAIIASSATISRHGDDASKARAKTALQAVLEKVQNEGIRERAQGVLDSLQPAA